MRGYRAIEAAGLGDAVALHTLNAALAAQLWLPLSLIEVASRNAVDQAVRNVHEQGEDWLISAGRCPDGLSASAVVGLGHLCCTNEDGTTDDPVGVAARLAASQLRRSIINRDDLIAHLMLGFWVVRVPEGLGRGEIDLFGLLSNNREAPLDDPAFLREVMLDHVARTRNDVAHHEPLLFRRKHIFGRDGNAKAPIALVDSLLGAIGKFTRSVERIAGTARAFAPMAAGHVDDGLETIHSLLLPIEERYAAERERLLAASRARREARRSGNGQEGGSAG